jgi:molybdopterin molybdotransferase
MLTLEEAQERLLARARLTDGEEVPLAAASGRVLVDPRIVASGDVPAFANSSMDGFAVQAASTPGVLLVVGEVAAGPRNGLVVGSGQAARIYTGAALPEGADTVVPIEAARDHGATVEVEAAPPGAYVRAAGSDTRAGTTVELPGMLDAAAIAVLASLGAATAMVRRRPVVAVLSTGDELVDPGEPLRLGQIYDANTPALAAAIQDAGGHPQVKRRVADEPDAIQRALTDASATADLIVTSGGVSVGRHDHVRSVLEARGSIDFWRIAVQPGKPLAVGTFGDRTVIGLPGNPVSALVTFELFARPFIRRMLGLRGSGRQRVRARVDSRIPKDRDRRAFLRVSVNRTDDGMTARSAGGQGSAQVRAMAAANGLLVVPEGEEAAEPGRDYDVLITGSLE